MFYQEPVKIFCHRCYDFVSGDNRLLYIYDGADTDRQYPNTHIHIHVQYTTQTFHVSISNEPPFMILIYIHVTGEHFVLGPIDKTKIISSRISYQTTLLLGKPNAIDVKGMRSFVLF